MPRIIIVAMLVLAAGSAGAQELKPERGIDAAEYIKGLLAAERYDPRHRERALNGAREIDPHWRSTIFDGRRTRSTRGTGLRLPTLPEPAAE